MLNGAGNTVTSMVVATGGHMSTPTCSAGDLGASDLFAVANGIESLPFRMKRDPPGLGKRGTPWTKKGLATDE